MNGPQALYDLLQELEIEYTYYEHPPAPTAEEACVLSQMMNAQHCKNIFLRNHKGNQHYLLCFPCTFRLDIQRIEQTLHQGKLSFASEVRLERYLGVKPGSVTPFGLMNDVDHHVVVYLDKTLQEMPKVAFHPLVNTASLSLSYDDLLRWIDHCGQEVRIVPLGIEEQATEY